MEAWRKFKQKVPHARAKEVGNQPEVLHRRFGPCELLDVSDNLANLGRIDRASTPGLPHQDQRVPTVGQK